MATDAIAAAALNGARLRARVSAARRRVFVAKRPNVVLLDSAAEALKQEFVGWQCRLRQLSVREAGGRPSAGMRPRASAPDGSEIAPAITVLIHPAEPAESTQLFRFQVQKTHDPTERYSKALELLSGFHYQRPRDFSDVLTALFAPSSEIAGRLLDHGACELEFAEYSRGFRLPCRVLQLGESDPLYQATYWHNRLFNPNMPATVRVLSFTPDWPHAESFDYDTAE